MLLFCTKWNKVTLVVFQVKNDRSTKNKKIKKIKKIVNLLLCYINSIFLSICFLFGTN